MTTKDQAIARELERIAYEAPISGNHMAQARVLMAAKMYAAQPPAPDCRTCEFKIGRHGWDNEDCVRRLQGSVCTNGDQYHPAPAVVLWRTE